MTRFRHFLKSGDGTASIEFCFAMPIVLLIIMASFESGLYMARHVMLERSVDLVVRDIRLGLTDGMTHLQLKQAICDRSALVESKAACVDSMRIWLQPINTATFAMVAPPKSCVDRAAPIDPLAATPDTEFKFGSDNEIMLMRICLKERPMFPTTAIGTAMLKDETDGHYALVTTSVFVNEPS